MNKSGIAFASLLLFAGATSFLAVSGVVGTLQSSGGQPVAYSTSSVASTSAAATPSATSTQASTSSLAPGGALTTTATTTVSTTTTSVTSATAATTTAVASGSGGFWRAIASSQGESTLRQAQVYSLFLAPVSWLVLIGAWMWRGRVRSRYTELGFGSDVFELFMKMKGGSTRIKVLSTLSTPKDRLQLAEELGVDWKTVDRHVQILNRYGFVREQASFGTVRLYEVTPVGRMLLNLFDDLERTDGPVARGQATRGPRD